MGGCGFPRETNSFHMKPIVSILCLISLSAGLFASEPDQKIDPKIVPPRAPSRESLVPTQAEKDARLGWWRDARFGMFIHWGVSSILGGTWKGEKVSGYAEHIQRLMKIPIPVYREEVARKFNPTGFNADAWVRTAKETGMKYIIITAKHHDGFAMYDSKVSDYNIVKATPFGRDPMAELRAACKKYDVKFGFYYSHALDWGDKDAPGNDWDYKNPDSMGNWWGKNPTFLAQARNYVDNKAIPQIKELIQNYDPDIMWFDVPNNLPSEENLRILTAVRKAKPSMVVNGRLIYGLGDYESTDDKPGDFPPQTYPDWEGIPTTNGSYGFNQNDHSHKEPKYFIQLLAKAAARGGNILLNVGPMGNGKMDAKDILILQGIGAWWKVNGQSIRGSAATPLAVQAWGESTRKGNELFLHLFDWPKDGHLVVGGLKSDVKKAVLLSDPTSSLKVTRVGMDVVLDIPPTAPDLIDSVIAITCNEAPQGDKARLISSSQTNVLRSLDGRITSGLLYNNCQQTDYIRNWKKLDATVTWPARLNQKTTFDVSVICRGEKAHPEIPGNPDAGQMPRPATKGHGGTFQVSFGGQSLQGTIAPSEGNITSKLGQVTLEPGQFDISIKATEITGDELMNLRHLILTPVDQPTPLPKQVFVVPNFHPASCGWVTVKRADLTKYLPSVIGHPPSGN